MKKKLEADSSEITPDERTDGTVGAELEPSENEKLLQRARKNNGCLRPRGLHTSPAD